jgi:hypothetical protein
LRNLFILLIIASANIAYSQIQSEDLEYRLRPDSLKTGELHLSIHNFNYLRNYEYFNRIQDGYTLFGAQLEPQLVYFPNKQLSVAAGIHLRKDFGGRGIHRSYPLFSIKYQKGHTTLINGVLEGNVHHRMVDPLYDFEKKITEPVEYGTQFIIQNEALFFDAFINWKHMIYKPSPSQEQILGGASADISLINNEKLKLGIPVQLTVFHQGGQIDTVDAPLQTLVNSALGFNLSVGFQGFVTAFRSENYYTLYRDLSFTSVQSFQQGRGWYVNNGIDTRLGSLMTTYWDGSGYISTEGMPLFQSVSQHISHEGFTQKNRQLLMLRYSYQQKLLPNLYIDFRFEPFMDLNRPGSKRIEFSNSTFLLYKQEIRLHKVKK